MKILQLNIWQGRIIRQVADLIAAEDPDIVCMQEVLSAPQDVQRYFEFMRSYELLQELLPAYEHGYFTPTFSFSFMDQKIQNGIATISKIPLNGRRSVDIHGTFKHSDDPHENTPNIRVAQIMQAEVRGKNVWIVNHHGYHIFDQYGDDNTLKATQKLAGELQKLKGPVIVCADMNIVAESKAMRPFDAQFVDLTDTHKLKTTLSQLSHVPLDIPCDHILVTKDIDVQSFSSYDTAATDHRPLIVEFDL